MFGTNPFIPAQVYGAMAKTFQLGALVIVGGTTAAYQVLSGKLAYKILSGKKP